MYVDRNEMIDKDPSRLENKRRNKDIKIKAARNMAKANIPLLLLLCCAVFFGVYTIVKALGIGTNSVSMAYETARDQALSEMSEKFHQMGYDKGETEYHVSNKATLSVETIKETAKLEVLQVSDIEFIAVDEDENNANITAVLEVPGTGIYTVDLEAAEFVVDKNRSYVLVRVQQPELSECKINYGGVNKLYFENDLFNDSISVGEDLAREMLKDAYLRIHNEFASNARYYSNAQTSAENLIRNMVKELNPTVEGLIVDVEFVD